MPRSDDTIFALSSGHGRAGVAVVRLSGPGCLTVLERFGGHNIESRVASLTTLVNPNDLSVIDRALCLSFPGPKSFTGEDVVELHVHGSRAVLDELFDVLGDMKGLRPADPGEFTRRAFDNGKMDLTEVEGLADLIDAETRAQKSQAMAHAGGAFSSLVNDWRMRIVKASALVEADIDFADEDLPDDLWDDAGPLIRSVFDEIVNHLDDRGRGERLREGYRVAILGAPNVGKSSFLNLLAKRDVAIVSDEPGTTRDIVEVHLDIKGLPVKVMDTAGLREGAGVVEAEGIRRALQSAEDADLRIWMIDSRSFPEEGGTRQRRRPGDFLLWNKADLLSKEGQKSASFRSMETDNFLISTTDQSGIETVLHSLEEKVVNDLEGEGGVAMENPGITRARHRKELSSCARSLGDLLERSEGPTGLDTDLLAEDLRQAARSLGRLTGRVDVEEILDHIFHDFCIGK